MADHPVKMLENKGQMKDMAGKPVDFVLFKIEADGSDNPEGRQLNRRTEFKILEM